ncbi:MAG: hypothetical protein ACI88L_000362 [Candidatus Paceibacteria bacterium]|jgi:hypothetical protein
MKYIWNFILFFYLIILASCGKDAQDIEKDIAGEKSPAIRVAVILDGETNTQKRAVKLANFSSETRSDSTYPDSGRILRWEELLFERANLRSASDSIKNYLREPKTHEISILTTASSTLGGEIYRLRRSFLDSVHWPDRLIFAEVDKDQLRRDSLERHEAHMQQIDSIVNAITDSTTSDDVVAIIRDSLLNPVLYNTLIAVGSDEVEPELAELPPIQDVEVEKKQIRSVDKYSRLDTAILLAMDVSFALLLLALAAMVVVFLVSKRKSQQKKTKTQKKNTPVKNPSWLSKRKISFLVWWNGWNLKSLFSRKRTPSGKQAGKEKKPNTLYLAIMALWYGFTFKGALAWIASSAGKYLLFGWIDNNVVRLWVRRVIKTTLAISLFVGFFWFTETGRPYKDFVVEKTQISKLGEFYSNNASVSAWCNSWCVLCLDEKDSWWKFENHRSWFRLFLSSNKDDSVTKTVEKPSGGIADSLRNELKTLESLKNMEIKDLKKRLTVSASLNRKSVKDNLRESTKPKDSSTVTPIHRDTPPPDKVDWSKLKEKSKSRKKVTKKRNLTDSPEKARKKIPTKKYTRSLSPKEARLKL